MLTPPPPNPPIRSPTQHKALPYIRPLFQFCVLCVCATVLAVFRSVPCKIVVLRRFVVLLTISVTISVTLSPTTLTTVIPINSAISNYTHPANFDCTTVVLLCSVDKSRWHSIVSLDIATSAIGAAGHTPTLVGAGQPEETHKDWVQLGMSELVGTGKGQRHHKVPGHGAPHRPQQ